jgi:hypothetical protein
MAVTDHSLIIMHWSVVLEKMWRDRCKLNNLFLLTLNQLEIWSRRKSKHHHQIHVLEENQKTRGAHSEKELSFVCVLLFVCFVLVSLLGQWGNKLHKTHVPMVLSDFRNKGERVKKKWYQEWRSGIVKGTVVVKMESPARPKESCRKV